MNAMSQDISSCYHASWTGICRHVMFQFVLLWRQKYLSRCLNMTSRKVISNVEDSKERACRCWDIDSVAVVREVKNISGL